MALPALLLPFLFSGEPQNLITNGSGRALKISGLIILFVLRVAVRSMCCQSDLAIVPAVQGWEKKASGKGLHGGFVSAGAGCLGLRAPSNAIRVLQDLLQDLDGVNEVQARSCHGLDSICGCVNAFIG